MSISSVVNFVTGLSIPQVISGVVSGIGGYVLINRLLGGSQPRLLDEEKWGEVANTARSIGKLLKIEKEIELEGLECDSKSVSTFGSTLLPGRVKVVFGQNAFKCLTKGEQEFVLAHELSHVKNNDYIASLSLKMGFFPIAFVALRVLFPTMSIWPLAGIAWVTNNVVYSIFSQWREKCADRMGFSICSQEGKRGAVTFFSKSLKAEKERGLLFKGEFITEQLLALLLTGITHPQRQTRVQYTQEWVDQSTSSY